MRNSLTPSCLFSYHILFVFVFINGNSSQKSWNQGFDFNKKNIQFFDKHRNHWYVHLCTINIQTFWHEIFPSAKSRVPQRSSYCDPGGTKIEWSQKWWYKKWINFDILIDHTPKIHTFASHPFTLTLKLKTYIVLNDMTSLPKTHC